MRHLLVVFALGLVLSCFMATAQAQSPEGTITTIAGNGTRGIATGDGGPATQADLANPYSIFVAETGDIYFADGGLRIRKIDFAGIITTVVGNGTTNNYGGDGGPATQAQISGPVGIWLDKKGNLFFMDTSNNRVRKVDANGIITTVAGNGTKGFSGDGGPATEASLNTSFLASMAGVFVDDGNIYFTDVVNRRVRKVDVNGIITTVAGGGIPQDGFGDGGPATEAAMLGPYSVFVDRTGILISTGSVIRKVDSNGIISTIAGTGPSGFSGDGGPATEARLSVFQTSTVDKNGNIFIADQNYHSIRKIDAVTGIITKVVGGGDPSDGFGDGGPATEARLKFPAWVGVDRTGALYIADLNNRRIRKVAGQDNIPLAAVDRPELDFGTVVPEQSASRSLKVYNPGTGILVASLSASDSAFAISPESFELQPRTFQEVLVEFSAPDSGFSGPDTLWVNSNDPDFPALPILLTGQIGRRPGDVNGDGQVNISDIVIMIKDILRQEPLDSESSEYAAADINKDGNINILDIVRAVNIILGRVLAKPAADASAVTVSLGSAGPDGEFALMFQSDGPVAGLQVELKLANQSKPGKPQATGRAAGMGIASRVQDDAMVLVIYSVAGGIIPAGNGAIAVIPVSVTGLPSISQAVVAGSQGQSIPVVLGPKPAKVGLPIVFALAPNRPNPFNPSTTIAYDVPQSARVTLVVYNLLGQEVARLVDKLHEPGRFEVEWNAAVASGIYFYQMTASTGFVQTRRMILLK